MLVFCPVSGAVAGKFTVARAVAGGGVRNRRAGCFESPLKTSLIKLISNFLGILRASGNLIFRNVIINLKVSPAIGAHSQTQARGK